MSGHIDTRSLEELRRAAQAEFEAGLDAYIERFKEGVTEALHARREQEAPKPSG